MLGEQAGVVTLEIVAGQEPVAIAKRAMDQGAKGGFDVVMLEYGRAPACRRRVDGGGRRGPRRDRPDRKSPGGRRHDRPDAVNVAQSFKDTVGVTGIVLTRVDGDARGGAALSMRQVTGCPIKLIGVGEKLDALEAFHPDRIAGRILGMGDVVSLVERPPRRSSRTRPSASARSSRRARSSIWRTWQAQLKQLRKMGGMDG